MSHSELMLLIIVALFALWTGFNIGAMWGEWSARQDQDA